jgi:Nickel responsive protein SCO4226-like
MPLFMDVHHKVEGLTAEAVGDAHKADLETQEKHGVNYLRYWFNEEEGRVYCLVEAPNQEAAEAVHREAHGLLADEIIEVEEGS